MKTKKIENRWSRVRRSGVVQPWRDIGSGTYNITQNYKSIMVYLLFNTTLQSKFILLH